MNEVHVLVTQRFPEPLVDRLRAVSTLLKVHLHPARTSEELPADVLPEVEVLYTWRALPEPETVPNLRWIQFHLSGIDEMASHPLVRSGVTVTTLSGANTPQMAEFALMAILGLARRVPALMREKDQKKWAADPHDRFRPTDLRGSTVGIVGYGSIGRELARLCHPIGVHILAVKRNLKDLQDEGYLADGLGDPRGDLAERIYPPQALRSMASLCDFLVVCTPLTPETRGSVNQAVLEAMKPTAFLIDISRGGVVDHGALVEALAQNRLAGAALDVYPVEPLPESSPLWEMPNVILSPHIAGASPRYYEQAAELFAQNLRRYLSDQPLLNRYDPARGY